MKILIKNTPGLLILLFAVLIPPGCGEDYEVPDGLCDILTEFTINKEIGRVYYRNEPGDPVWRFYYIGHPDTAQRNGGYVPCNGLSDVYIPEGEIGVLVRFSGRIRYGFDRLDPDEPIYSGIDLTFIEKADEDSQ